MNLFINNRGYSLVEVMVAITILMLAIAGPLTIASKGIQSAQFTKDQTAAYFLAQEGIEAFFTVRNEAIIAGVHAGDMSNVWNWASTSDSNSYSSCFINNPAPSLASNGNSGCNLDFHDETLSNNIVDCDTTTCVIDHNTSTGERAPFQVDDTIDSYNTQYTRVIQIEHLNDHEVFVTSTVSWSASVFFGTTESVSLSTSIFKLYES